MIPPVFDPDRDSKTGLLNPTELRHYSSQLADPTSNVLDLGEVPLVLGVDCSILLGTMLALRRRGRYGLLFIDGHADFYQPAAEPNGEAASMDLALATGRGPEVVTDLEGRRPFVRDEDVVHLGRRNAQEAEAAGSRRIEDAPITVVDLAEVRRLGMKRVAQLAIDRLGAEGARRVPGSPRLRRPRRRRDARRRLSPFRWFGLGRAVDPARIRLRQRSGRRLGSHNLQPLLGR